MNRQNASQTPIIYPLPAIHQFPYEKEILLLAQLTGTPRHIRATLNDLLGYILTSDRGSMILMKEKIMEIASVYTRIFIETGYPMENIRELNSLCPKNNPYFLSYDDLYELIHMMTDYFIQCIQATPYLTNTQKACCQACGYIARNYAGQLTLQTVADYVHLNASYFSAIFSDNYGITFKDYLNQTRIEKAKQLLTTSNYSIIEIAVSTGYEDQSYFTKMFKKLTGISPGRYRTNRS